MDPLAGRVFEVPDLCAEPLWKKCYANISNYYKYLIMPLDIVKFCGTLGVDQWSPVEKH